MFCGVVAGGGGALSPTPGLTGAAGARTAVGTNTGHKNAKGIASVGVRVEPTVRPHRWPENKSD